MIKFKPKLFPAQETALIRKGDSARLHPRIQVTRGWLSICCGANDLTYDYELSRLISPAECLDLIFQVANKDWCDLAMVGELVHALEHAICRRFKNNAQGVLCPGGTDMVVDWARRTYAPRKRA